MIAAREVSELLQQLIRNSCVNDGTPGSGGEVRSVDTLDAYLGVVGERREPHPGRVSVLYRIPGSGNAPTLMLMGHTDVVPVNRDGWSVDPFAGERRDGFVWGRGAIDMLNQTAAMAAVFKRFASGEHRYPGDLVFLAVADEEAGGKLGARWLVEDHWAWVSTDYLLTEIGTPALAGRRGMGIPVTVAEKGSAVAPAPHPGCTGSWQPAICHRQCTRADGCGRRRARGQPTRRPHHRGVEAIRRRVGSAR